MAGQQPRGNDRTASHCQVRPHPTPWPHPKIYNTLSFEFGGFRSKDDTGSLVSRSKRLDLGYQVQRPFRLGKGFTYTPFLSYRLQDYSTDGPDAMRSWGEWGNELHYTMHGDYDVQNEVWKINGMRHVVDFSVSHRKVNRLDSENTALIPLIDYSLVDLNMGPTAFWTNWSPMISSHTRSLA